MSALLLNQFRQLNHQDKYEKVMIYFNAVQKSEENFIGIYRVIANGGADGIDDDMLTQLYTALLNLVEYDNQEKFNEASKYLKYIQQLKQTDQGKRAIK